MTIETNAERLEEIRNRDKLIEEGPWYFHGNAFHGYRISLKGRGVDVAQAERRHIADFISKAREDIPLLLSEIDKLREALEFYADKESYVVNVADQWEPIFPVLQDDGETARKALKGELE